MPETGHYRLEDLKQRWKRDPSSRLFLQLADEHRKLGQYAEAVAVLEQGLEKRPGDLSALVALGRCRLETEQVAEAVEALETVIARDPAHMVANKLLLEAHLRLGDAEKAGARLETYRLLNDRDPELDHLSYRLERLRSGDDREAPTAVEADSAKIDEEVESPLELAEPEPMKADAEEIDDGFESPPELAEPEPAEADSAEFDEEVEPALELAESEPVEAGAGETAAAREETSEEAEASEPPVTAPDETSAPSLFAGESSGSDPFQLVGDLPPPDLSELWEPPSLPKSVLAEPFRGLIGLDAARHWELLAGEGIFVAPASAPAAGNGGAAAPAEPEPVTKARPADALEPAEKVEAPEEPAPREAEKEPEADLAAEPEAVEPPAEIGEEEGMGAAAGLVAGALAAAGAAAVAAVPEPETREPAVAAAEPAGEPATATLGELYLRQGHREEAERIFRQVLERDPRHPRALAGLERLARRQRGSKPLTAADLLAVRTAGGRVPEGLTAKKVLVLTNYIQHLRAASRHVH